MDQNLIQDELLQLFCKKGYLMEKLLYFEPSFFLHNGWVKPVSWWEKFRMHVLRLQKVTL